MMVTLLRAAFQRQFSVVMVMFCFVAALVIWNVFWGTRSVTGFISFYPDVDLRTAKDGQYVKVTGVVTCGNFPLESSFQRVPRCVYTSTCLYEYRGWESKAANTGHRRFTWGLRSMERHAVDFYISDFQSGLRALVKTGYGARVAPYVDESVVIDINPDNKGMSPEFLRWLRERNLSSDDRIMRLKEGYIKEGSTVSVMGVVQRNDNVLMIVPPSEPISTGCQWAKCILPTSLDGLVLRCEDTSNNDSFPASYSPSDHKGASLSAVRSSGIPGPETLTLNPVSSINSILPPPAATSSVSLLSRVFSLAGGLIAMAAAEAKAVVVPESVLKKRKREEQWAADKKEKVVAEKKKAVESRKLIFSRAKQYAEEYDAQEKELVQLKREARMKGGFYVSPEAKLLFVVRIRGINAMHPKTRKILQLLRLRQIFNGVFLKVNKATINMLRRVEPYVAYGYPNLKSIRELIYKRGYGKLNKQRIPLTNNKVIDEGLGKHDIICIEDLVHEIKTVGPHFKEANNFLWPFKLKAPLGGLKKKRNHYVEGGDAGNREDYINELIRRMN
ncbi:hypothetical protein GUJ93_ZPchr0010g11100 [Zizania palustris]|uniref:60S ribosomal protein L7 n=1 Tax=Zizania palustris TaxID=103762 RepID=A0A8J5WCN7_ZIZPA|nr:hypothetical protein GUJ93_ZPchr0010g11100 [Zizania palustris]